MKFGYTRTSTRDKQTDDLQRRALIAAGVEENNIYADQVSGSKSAKSRSGWSTLDARLREEDELVIWRLDRLGRSMVDVVTTIDDLTERGIKLMSVTDGIDPETPSGRLVLQILSSLAEYERSLIRERVQAGVDAARERGVRFGRPEADPEEVARKLRTVEHLVENEDMTVVDAAKTIGWSKSTYYRHLSSAGTA